MFPRTIADRNHEVERLLHELGNVLRTVGRKIDSDFFHDLNSLRMQSLRMCSCAKYLKSFASHLPEQSFRHLAPLGDCCEIEVYDKARDNRRPTPSRVKIYLQSV